MVLTVRVGFSDPEPDAVVQPAVQSAELIRHPEREVLTFHTGSPPGATKHIQILQ